MSSFDTEVPALLLRLDANPFHHGTLGAVRSLGRAGVETHVLLGEPAGPVTRSRYLGRAHRWDAGRHTGAGGYAELLGRLREIAAEIGRPAVLLPMDDHGALAVARLAPQLADDYLLARVDPALVERVADKAELAALCAAHGIAHPLTRQPASAAEAAHAAAELGLPVVAKWSRPWLLPPGGGLRSTSLVHQPAHAHALFERGRDMGGRLLIQRLLPGRPGCDWFFHGCFDRHGRLLAGGSGLKERCWPPGAGLTAAGRWTPNEEIERAATRLAAALGYHGVLDLDFRHDQDGDTYHLLDFNPRPGAQFRLFTDADGLDVVRATYLDLTGQPVPRHVPAPGRRLLVEQYALAATLLRSGHPSRTDRTTRSGSARTATSPRAGRDTAWYARDDPLPFLALVAAVSRRVLVRLLAPLRRPVRRRTPQPGGRRPRPPRPRQSASDPPCHPSRPRATTGQRRTQEENADV